MDSRYSELSAAEAKFGVTIEYHCSDSHTEYIVALQKPYYRARRGHIVDVSPREMLAVDPDAARERLEGFAAQFALTVTEPKWCLVSYWG